ncbi:lytic transglycosylase [Actinophytocola xanthii]|uniref:Lytic transglycosylase n=2 Tax=Actinophytocola xanthii TaxID=1912961 RepID=A0A1Q8CZ79_9PSEU|nr:lytic transglycosylase [Actinophytocola xanthii]
MQEINTMIRPPVAAAPAATAGATATASGTGFASALEGVLGTSASTGVGAAATGGAASETAVVAGARKYIGVPYVWGGTDPARGLDCSGLVQRVYADLGVSLPRVSRDQAKAGTAVPSLDQARPGDLVAFGSPVHHIGIYIGDGKMIHAPQAGENVRVQDVYETPTAIRRILPSGTASASAASLASVSGASVPSGGAYASLFSTATARHGLPQGLLAAVAKAESNFNPSAVSHAGARGLMQLMPATAAGLGVDPMNPAQAVDGAARLLKSHLSTFDSVPLALAAYNAGPGAVRRYDGIPPYAETQNYVRKIMGMLGGTP